MAEGGLSDLERDWQHERKKFFLSMLVPFVMVALMWLVKAVEVLFNIDFYFLGIYPRQLHGLIGIITSLFIHANLNHLFNNSLPLFVLGTALFYFYSRVAFRVLFWVTVLTGIAVWIFGRQSYHIGVSGLLYGLAAFLFFSGLLRKHIPLIALSLLVAFLYGEMVWGIFPGLKLNISWESHMLGAVAGIFLAIRYRREGPQAPVPFPDEEDQEEECSGENGDDIENVIN